MDFRTLINKLDSFNTEAKKEPERMQFSDAINHVKDITFTPPTPKQNEFSIANNVAFRGKDLTDPNVRLALFQDELKRSPGRLLGEIAQRIKPTSDSQIELSMFVGEISEKEKGNMSKEEQTLAIAVIKQAIRSMDVERDADQSTYKDSDEPDASEMESTNEAEKRWKQTSMSPEEAIKKYGKEHVKVKKGALRNGDDMVEVHVESMSEAEEKDFDFSKDNLELCDTCDKPIDKCECKGHDHSDKTTKEAVGDFAKPIYDLLDQLGDNAEAKLLHDLIRYLDADVIKDFVDEFRSNHDYGKGIEYESSMSEADFDRSSVTYDEVLPFVKMTYKELLTDLQTARKDIETYKAGGDTGEEGGDIDMVMPYLRDLKDMQVKVKAILDNPDMDIETVVDYMMPADLDTSPREDLIGRFKKSFAKDPQLAKKLFKDPQLDFYSEGVEATEDAEWFKGLTDVSFNGDEFYEAFGWIEENDENVVEAEYQGRTVKLNKPMRGDVKKFKVYVTNPKGNVVKVNFGDPDMRIKKSNPARRRSFRARHNCDNPGPKTKARYWSCRKW